MSNHRFVVGCSGNGKPVTRFARAGAAHVAGSRVGVEIEGGHTVPLGGFVWVTMDGGNDGSPARTPLGVVELQDGEPAFLPRASILNAVNAERVRHLAAVADTADPFRGEAEIINAAVAHYYAARVQGATEAAIGDRRPDG